MLRSCVVAGVETEQMQARCRIVCKRCQVMCCDWDDGQTRRGSGTAVNSIQHGNSTCMCSVIFVRHGMAFPQALQSCPPRLAACPLPLAKMLDICGTTATTAAFALCVRVTPYAETQVRRTHDGGSTHGSERYRRGSWGATVH